MTLVLKSGMSRVSFVSIESIARALRQSCAIVLLRKVFILFKVEKHLSDSWCGDEDLEKTYSFCECVLKVIFH